MEYILKNKNTPILKLNMDEETGIITKITDIYQLEYRPLGISVKNGIPNRSELNRWWQGRNIPASRDGLQEALFKMNLTHQSELIVKCFGLSLSDQYWIQPKNTSLTWEDINFFTNEFSNDVGEILFGKEINGNLNLCSPDNTSDGWLKKKWKMIDGEHYLIKAGSSPYFQEPVNETIASCLFQRLNVPHVPYQTIYEEGEPYSICKNFITKDTELITAYPIFQLEKKPNHLSNYQHLVAMFHKIGITNIEEFLNQMLACDYLLVNADRHLNNFGVIRDVNTLEIKGIAPIFDTGSSLWYDTLTQRIKVLVNSSKPFSKTHEEQIKLVSSLEWFQPEKLKGFEEEMSELLKQSDYIDTKRRDILCRHVRTRIKLLEEKREQMQTKIMQAVTKNETNLEHLLESTEQVLIEELKRAGFVPSGQLISNLKQFNAGRNRIVSIKEMKQIWKTKSYQEEEKEVVEAIVKELQQQEQKYVNHCPEID